MEKDPANKSSFLRPKQGDMTAMMKGLVRLIEKSTIRHNQDQGKDLIVYNINQIRQLKAGSAEMNRSMVLLWVNSVNAMLDDAEDYNSEKNIDKNDSSSEKVTCTTTTILSNGLNAAITKFESNNDISVNAAADSMIKSNENHWVRQNNTIIAHDFFVLMHACKVKLGELKYGTHLLIKSKSATFSV